MIKNELINGKIGRTKRIDPQINYEYDYKNLFYIFTDDNAQKYVEFTRNDIVIFKVKKTWDAT